MKKETKKVEMTVSSKEAEKETKKLSYEELEQVAARLQAQCQELYSNLCEARAAMDALNEVHLLLRVLERADCFTDSFIERCSKVVENMVNVALDQAEAKKEESK